MEAAQISTSFTSVSTTTSEWRSGLPVLRGETFTLRELRMEDAPSLVALLNSADVSQFISPPPSSVEAFERFIEWTHAQREAGNYVCFAIVPTGMSTAIGIFQLRALEQGFGTAEWGFAIGSQFWGSGFFVNGARLVIDFAFDVIGVNRLEARASVANARANGALRKIGAVQEGVLRAGFIREGLTYDQVLWGMVADDWRLQRLPQEPARTN
jgi:ribosomal-protein-alanine N-acetyltransferase